MKTQTESKLKLENRFANCLISPTEYQKIFSTKINSRLIFKDENEYIDFNKNIINAIEYRDSKNKLKGVQNIKEYQRANEREIAWLGAYGEELIEYLIYKIGLHKVVNNYFTANTASYVLSKGNDFSFDYNGQKINYEIKTTKKNNVKINYKAFNHLIDNQCFILVVQVIEETNKLSIFQMSAEHFKTNATLQEGQNGTKYFQYNF